MLRSRALRPQTLSQLSRLSRTMASTSVVPPDVQPLSEAHQAAVLATVPVLAEHGVTITKQMYKVSKLLDRS